MNEKTHTSAPLWIRSDTTEFVRQPKTEVKLCPANSQIEPSTSTFNGLNVDAPEFVPRAAMTEPIENRFENLHIENTPKQSTRNTAQNRLQRIRGATNESNQEVPSPLQSSSPQVYNDSIDMLRLKQIISSLINYPGQFDDLLMVFMETVCPYSDSDVIMDNIVVLLVDEAIDCPNFRYNGARLCYYVQQTSKTFKSSLAIRCKRALRDHPDLQNAVLFVSELYTQMPQESINGPLLIDSFMRLLEVGGDQNVKCICQALKLTGYILDQHDKEDMNELFMKLRQLSNSFHGSVEILLKSVINLRESNWGRGSAELSNNSDYSDGDQYFDDIVNEIQYETNGEALTNEENEFLTYATNSDFIMDNDPDALCNPEPEMDEEIQEAFKEFVKLNRN